MLQHLPQMPLKKSEKWFKALKLLYKKQGNQTPFLQPLKHHLL